MSSLIRKPIKDFGGRYSVSTQGEVYSHLSGRFLKVCVTGRVPYCRVTLVHESGSHQTKLVHRLVAETFLEGSGECVRHISGDSTDNRVENLEWGSYRENERDKRRHGTDRAETRNPQAKLTPAQVREIRRAPRGTVKGLAQKFGISVGRAYSLRSGRWWKGQV